MNDQGLNEATTPQMVHQGRNRTCCRGKCFINSEPGRCALTLLMINVPVAATISLTFEEIFVEGFPDHESFIWVATVLIMIYLTAAANFNMIWCSVTDPGIVPARRWPTYVAEKYDTPKQKYDYYTHALAVNQRYSPHLFKFTFCKTCQVFQPPRCNHCPVCQTCVLELDHHCHWLGTCLGLRNYHSFYWFVLHLVILNFGELVFVPIYAWRVTLSRELREDDHEFDFIRVEWIVLLVVVLFVLANSAWICKLYYFHQCYVTTQGRTAYEMLKYHYDSFETSPHKQGSSCANFCKLVCRPRRVLDSRLDYQLQAAASNQAFSMQRLIEMRDRGIIDQSVNEDEVFVDNFKPNDRFEQFDMKECKPWQLTFQSRKQARGNLRFFQKIRRVKAADQKQASARSFGSNQKLLSRASNDGDGRDTGEPVDAREVNPQIIDQSSKQNVLQADPFAVEEENILEVADNS